MDAGSHRSLPGDARRIRNRRADTQAEIDEEQTKLIEQQGSIIRALATALFNVGNDVRVLKGQKPVTQDQFRDYIKGLLR